VNQTAKQYYPQLDALRGLGIILVFFYHAYKPAFGLSLVMQFLHYCYENIYLSMDMFFALSAFIITHLALAEIRSKGSFSFKNFMVRRILRIWPLYFLILLLAYTLIKYTAAYFDQPLTLPPAGWYVFFVSNFYLEPHVFFLRQLWTISVEEQFYVFWGIILFYFRKYITWIMIIAALISIVFTIISAVQFRPIYFHSLVYLYDMMAGAFFAYLVSQNAGIVRMIRSFTKMGSVLFYIFIPVLFIVFFFINKASTGGMNEVFDVLMRLLFVILMCMLFVDQMLNTHSAFNLSKQRFLIHTGKVAYGLYCFHGLVLTFGAMAFARLGLSHQKLVFLLLMFVITYVIATLSYRYFEKPFLDLKSKFGKTG
jgi:peptidoglycan/LPS O-acetylase OafA/YrhL